MPNAEEYRDMIVSGRSPKPARATGAKAGNSSGITADPCVKQRPTVAPRAGLHPWAASNGGSFLFFAGFAAFFSPKSGPATMS